jgi:hypothetical protein
MKKILKKIIALATALMMVPAITVSAASPINVETDGDFWGKINDMFPGLTEDESGIITELGIIHSELELHDGNSAVTFDMLLENIGLTPADLADESYGYIFAAYGVAFAGASRDWCVSMGTDPAKLDALLIKLGVNVSAPVASQAGSAPVWKQDGKGWWIENPDGSYLMNQWYQSPESGLWYYMGADGYMLTNTTTPDGCMVNADGVWIQ